MGLFICLERSVCLEERETGGLATQPPPTSCKLGPLFTLKLLPSFLSAPAVHTWEDREPLRRETFRQVPFWLLLPVGPGAGGSLSLLYQVLSQERGTEVRKTQLRTRRDRGFINRQ